MKSVFIKRLGAALLAAVSAAVFAAGCAQEIKPQSSEIEVPILEAKEIKYNTEAAVIGDITERYYVNGNFGYPYYERVSFKKSGTIKELNIEENATVKKGDVLCVLESVELDDELKEKKLYLDQAKKTLNTLLNDPGDATSNELELAKLDVDFLQLEYDHMEKSAEDYKVVAPCDGIFYADRNTSFGTSIDSQRGAQNIILEGAIVRSSQSFGTIADRSQKYIMCEVDKPLENVNFGTRVTLEQSSENAQGKVIDIMEGGNGWTKTTVYIIEQTGGDELSDLPVNCCFDVYSKPDTVIVPTKAVKKSKDRRYVELLIDGTKIEQDVETGIVDGDRTEIVSGLSGGEQIIIN